MREKRRPTLEELKTLPVELWRLEAAQISVDAVAFGVLAIETEAIDLIGDPDLTPEKVVALREELRRATGCTAAELEAAAPFPATAG